ncbi:myosin-6 isoform X1 [Quercus lobata]|uniref:myosin-6 isoform X1 n=1 Tax=Quercus lobata TaxID=97700 RepID=UPI0012445791|nr:myosin-6 isoform X1 [Quercus lobata]XP_030929833.1 myosin-6 isoform X1 [Quercus lobata]
MGAVVDDNKQATPIGAPKSGSPSASASPPNPNINNNNNKNGTSSSSSSSSKDHILSVASKIASQPLQFSDPDVWAVLTAISTNARKRHQSINMLLTADEHCIGRLVEDTRFQIESNAVSANHCKIYRRKLALSSATADDSDYSVFLKDTSTNGTYLNWEKLRKNSAEAKVGHGDIISFAAPPQHELAFAFVYREVLASTPVTDGAAAKRKAEDFVSENKRFKGIGIGAPEGPISLDDFRSLQRSNKELRKQLENQGLTIDTLRNENRASVQHHENEMKELKDSVTKSYVDQLNGLNQLLEVKQIELDSVNKISSEQKHSIEDLNRRLSASIQSYTEANAIMESQKASVAELKTQLIEERDQRRGEREKAAADLKAAVQRAQSEAQEELKRLSDAGLRREREQQEVINKLQESERERCLLVETLRSKLEDTRQKLVISDNNVRQLETKVCEEQLASANGRKRVETLEHEIKRLRKELEIEKQSAREEAWAKVSALELEINATLRDLDFERQRLKGARERIMLRETQLRAFYSTTEEISALFAKQQEQLKAMQRTLEDEENYENTSIDIDLNVQYGFINETLGRQKDATGYCGNSTAKAGPATSAQGIDRNQVEISSDEASVTEKHDCDFRSQEECQNTQEAEFTSADHGIKAAFGSEIDGVGTAPVLEGDAIGTEQVLETESPGFDGERNIDLNKSSTLAEDTMQIDDESHVQETDEHGQTLCPEARHDSQSNNPLENLKSMEDTEAGGTIRTTDLLASEVAGSWACSTAPSVHGENESPRSRDNDEEGDVALRDSNMQVAESQSTPSPVAMATRRTEYSRSRDNDEEGAMALHDSNVPVAESQIAPSSEAIAKRRNHERQALGEMIGIVAPDLKEQFDGAIDDDCDQGREKRGSTSDSDTESCTDNDDDNGVDDKGGSVSDTEGSDQADIDHKPDDAMDEDDEATQDNSLG